MNIAVETAYFITGLAPSNIARLLVEPIVSALEPGWLLVSANDCIAVCYFGGYIERHWFDLKEVNLLKLLKRFYWGGKYDLLNVRKAHDTGIFYFSSAVGQVKLYLFFSISLVFWASLTMKWAATFNQSSIVFVIVQRLLLIVYFKPGAENVVLQVWNRDSSSRHSRETRYLTNVRITRKFQSKTLTELIGACSGLLKEFLKNVHFKRFEVE